MRKIAKRNDATQTVTVKISYLKRHGRRRQADVPRQVNENAVRSVVNMTKLCAESVQTETLHDELRR